MTIANAPKLGLVAGTEVDWGGRVESPSSSWIIDTGASRHVTGDKTWLTHVDRILDCPVGLPNGTQATATLEGRVLLFEGLILSRVLFVPQLQCNIISVSQLIDDTNCNVRFTNSLCAIQDQRLGNLIGAGERCDGLYFFRGIPTVQAVTVPGLTEFELWHRRLGHPSERVVKLLPAIQSSSRTKKLNKPCDICPQANRHEIVFLLAKLKLVEFFNSFIVICGVQIRHPLLVVLFDFG